MELQFMGAVRTVTGSMHLLHANGEKLLVDCGLYQGHRKEAEKKNRHLPFPADSIVNMILTHAHIDHSGNIPNLVKSGFEGNIFTTFATRDLCAVMLRDSAHIQEKDAEYVNKKHKKRGLPPVEPIYTMDDARKSLEYFAAWGYNREFFVNSAIKVRFVDAGHILGSAQVVVDVEENGKKRRILFSGDLGRKKLPILRDPVQVTEADYLVIESTYGGRYHDPITNVRDQLAKVINRTYGRGGKIIVPAFSVGRTQELVYELHLLINERRIPNIPIYVDSPLSVNATEVFRLHPECYDREMKEEFLEKHEDPFGFSRLRYIRDVEESKKLNDCKGTCMIISASGMCEAGRILHHLKNNITDPKNTVLVVGYMAENTLGRRLVEREPVVKIFGDEYPLRSEVVVMNSFSAHADRNGLLNYVKNMDKNRLKHIFIVHGDPDQSEALADGLRKMGYPNSTIPVLGEKYPLE